MIDKFVVFPIVTVELFPNFNLAEVVMKQAHTLPTVVVVGELKNTKLLSDFLGKRYRFLTVDIEEVAQKLPVLFEQEWIGAILIFSSSWKLDITQQVSIIQDVSPRIPIAVLKVMFQNRPPFGYQLLNMGVKVMRCFRLPFDFEQFACSIDNLIFPGGMTFIGVSDVDLVSPVTGIYLDMNMSAQAMFDCATFSRRRRI